MNDPNNLTSEAGSQGTNAAAGDPQASATPQGKGWNQTLLVVVVVVALLIVVWATQRTTTGGAGGGASGTTQITDLKGKELDLAPYKGQVVMVNFWATWCSPCLIEMPWMMEFQEKYASRGFTVLGVSMDDEGLPVVEPWVREKQFDVNGRKLHLNYPILIGSDVVGQQFGGIIGLPTTLVIARDGTVVKRIIGIASHDMLAAEIEKQL